MRRSDHSRRYLLSKIIVGALGMVTTACVAPWSASKSNGATRDTSLKADISTITTAPPINTPILLQATPTQGTVPLQVEFSASIPVGVGTGCEAFYYELGNGEHAEFYTPCAYVVPSPSEGLSGTPFIPPTDVPRAATEISTHKYTYLVPGIYAAQFFLRMKPSDAIVAASNMLIINVTA